MGAVVVLLVKGFVCQGVKCTLTRADNREVAATSCCLTEASIAVMFVMCSTLMARFFGLHRVIGAIAGWWAALGHSLFAIHPQLGSWGVQIRLVGGAWVKASHLV